jgi:hypothetical protein
MEWENCSSDAQTTPQRLSRNARRYLPVFLLIAESDGRKDVTSIPFHFKITLHFYDSRSEGGKMFVNEA